MRVIRDLKLDGKVIGQVKELTVGEIRSWLLSKTVAGDLVDSMLFDEISLSDIPVLTTLTDDELTGLAPSEIDSLLPQLKEVNARFFMMREKVVALGRQVLAVQPKNESGILSEV